MPRHAPLAPQPRSSRRSLREQVEFAYVGGQIAVSRPVRVGGTTIRDTVFLDETEWNRMVDFVARHWPIHENGKVAL